MGTCDETPEAKALLATLLKNTFEDLFRPLADAARGVSHNTIHAIADLAVAKREAELWITGAIQNPTISFEKCCELLGMDPDLLRDRILKMEGPERAKIWRKIRYLDLKDLN